MEYYRRITLSILLEEVKQRMNLKRIVTTLVISIALLMVTGTGVVSAAQMDVKPDGMIDLIPGSDVPTIVYLTKMKCDGTDRTLEVSVKKGDPSDLTFKVTDLTGTPGTVVSTSEGIKYTYTPTAGTKEYTIQVDIEAASGTQGNTYILYYKDSLGGFDKASATVRGTAIPEFTTIALPLATTFGLLLLFNYRRRDK